MTSLGRQRDAPVARPVRPQGPDGSRAACLGSRRRKALAAAVSCATHVALLGCMALVVGGEGPVRQDALEIAASTVNEPSDFDMLEPSPVELDIQDELHVEAPSLETLHPSFEIAGTLGGGPQTDLADRADSAAWQGRALGNSGIGLGDRGTGSGAGGRGRYRRPFDRLVDAFRRDGLDLVIVFDSTSSMGAEVDTVKERIVEIGGVLMRKVPDTRIGVVTYKDYADTPTVAGIPLTKDLSQLNTFLAGVEATGGGKMLPEAVLPGLHWAMEHSAFRPAARKVILLFGDAPPYPADVPACVRLAHRFRVRRRGKLSTVTCRIPHPIREMRAIAHTGGGEALVLLHHERLLEELVVLIFGDRFRSDVYRFFEFNPPTKPKGNAT